MDNLPMFVKAGGRYINLDQVAYVSRTGRGFAVIQFGNGGATEVGGETAESLLAFLEALATDLAPEVDE